MMIAAYQAEHGDCPAVITGPNGDEHSWRMLIAPYVAGLDTYWDAAEPEIRYRFDEPWNSPHNSEVVQYLQKGWLLAEFQCPSEYQGRDCPSPYTSYLMLVRPNSDDDSKRPLHASAVLLVESANSKIPLAEPKDLAWETLWEGESPFGEGKLNSLHPGVVKALRVDGKVIDIPKWMNDEELKALLNGHYEYRQRFGPTSIAITCVGGLAAIWVLLLFWSSGLPRE